MTIKLGQEKRPRRTATTNESRWAKGGIIFSGIIAIANVFIATAIYLQLAEMKSSSKQTDQAIAVAKISAEAAKDAVKINKDQLRPWLTALVKDSKNLRSDNFAGWFMNVYYSNVGKTPALNVDMYGAFEIHEYPLAPTTQIDLLDPSKDGDNHTKKVILPGDEKAAEITFRPDEVPKNLNKLKDGKYWLYALGHVRYFDIYGEAHHTQYCAAYSYEAIIALRTGAADTLDGNVCANYAD